MASRGRGKGRGNCKEHNGFDNPTVAPSVRVQKKEWENEVQRKMSEFQLSGNPLLSFPPMDNLQRKRIHELANRNGLISHSEGKEPTRYVVLMKRKKPTISLNSLAVETSPIYLTKNMHDRIKSLVYKHNIREYDIDLYHSVTTAKKHHKNRNYPTQKMLANMIIPPRSTQDAQTNKLLHQRIQLPAYKMKENLLTAINRNKVVLITGGTGCGKTTQVPQFLLDDATAQGKPIRIICTQPRRLPAIAVAERVARERGEKIGDTVGYHIRLEQRVSNKTVLTYCTSGVLLRMLTQDEVVKNLSHIILDEIHEREQNTDYLLIALKQAISKQNDLKIILMSATMEGNLDMFKEYFGNVPVQHVTIPSYLYEVKKLYLGHILALTGYIPPESVFCSGISGTRPDGATTQTFSISDWRSSEEEALQMKVSSMQPSYCQAKSTFGLCDSESAVQFTVPPPTRVYNVFAQKLMATAPPFVPQHTQSLHNGMSHSATWSSGMDQYNHLNDQYAIEYPSTPEDFALLQQSFSNMLEMPDLTVPPPSVHQNWQNSSYEYRQTQHCYVNYGAQAYGLPESSTQSSYLSQPMTKPIYSSNSFGEDYQRVMNEERDQVQKMRSYFEECRKHCARNFSMAAYETMSKYLPNTEHLAEAYFQLGGKQYAEDVDTELISHLTRYLMDSPIEGAILIFLPGCDDISEVKEKIEVDCRLTLIRPYIFTLHSQMNTNDQHKVFERPPHGHRKVILSTNIAEASLTIDDVVFVIDSGKVKEKSYDHDSRISQLKTGWIARSNAEQRSGRAGRCQAGFCFRLYAEADYYRMAPTQKAEMQRAAIHEVCLHAKIFAPEGMSVRDFLSMAPEPPSLLAIDNSMAFLEQLGALYSQESTNDINLTGTQNYMLVKEPDMTDLGLIIAKLPLEPQLARMLLFGLALKVLTPIATLVSALSHRDPFIIPSTEDREKCNKMRDHFASTDYSDHLALLRAINEYESKSPSQQNEFCRRNFLSLPAMKMIIGIRKQLMGELKRANLIQDLHGALCDDEYNKYSNSWPMVQVAIAAGCYPGIGFTKPGSKLRKIRTGNEKPAGLHPSSVIKRQVIASTKKDSTNNATLEYLAYQELAQLDEGLTLKTVTVIPPIATVLAIGSIRLKQSIIREFSVACECELLEIEAEQDKIAGAGEEPKLEFGSVPSLPVYVIEDWLASKGTHEEFQSMRDILRLRFKLMSYFLDIIASPNQLHASITSHEDILKTVNIVLEEDHKRHGFNDVRAADYYNKERFIAQMMEETHLEHGRDQRLNFPKTQEPHSYTNVTYVSPYQLLQSQQYSSNQNYSLNQQYSSNQQSSNQHYTSHYGQQSENYSGYYQSGNDYRQYSSGSGHNYGSNTSQSNSQYGHQRNEEFRSNYIQENYSQNDNRHYADRVPKEDKNYDSFDKRDDYSRGSNGINYQKNNYKRGNTNYQTANRRGNYGKPRIDGKEQQCSSYQTEQESAIVAYPASAQNNVENKEKHETSPSRTESQDVRVQQGKIPPPVVSNPNRVEKYDQNRDNYKRDSARNNKREQLEKKKDHDFGKNDQDKMVADSGKKADTDKRNANESSRQQSNSQPYRNGHSNQKMQQTDTRRYENSKRNDDFNAPTSSHASSSQNENRSSHSAETQGSSGESKLVKLTSFEENPPPDPVIKNDKNERTAYRGSSIRYPRRYYKPKQATRLPDLEGAPSDYGEAQKEKEPERRETKKTYYNKGRNGMVFENSGLKNKNNNQANNRH